MTQVALSALRSIENPSVIVRAARDGLAFADRITFTGHIVGGVVIAAVPLAAQYAYAHPLVGLVASGLLLTGTVKRGLHRLAGVCMRSPT